MGRMAKASRLCYNRPKVQGPGPAKKEEDAMLEALTLAAFCGGLALCVALGQSILYALTFGLVLFLLYGRRRGFSWGALLGSALSGVKTVRNILFIFLLIGMLTALWRAGGTIPAIVCAAGALIRPEVFYLLSFLLNCGVSVLTGTSFGTAATMGVVCMTMARTMGLSPMLVGGAILAGAFFGDRWSPVSTSALLICQLTETSIFDNLKGMCATVALPQLFRLLLLGYHSGDPAVAAMLEGGGILSMVRCGAIVCLSSTYVGIFQKTGLLAGAKGAVERLAQAATPFTAILCTAGVASVIACNQTLVIMLTHQLCGDLAPDRRRFALDLEDSVVVLAPLVPWSLAGAVPLSSVDAPERSVLAACFLYLLPLTRLLGSVIARGAKIRVAARQ